MTVAKESEKDWKQVPRTLVYQGFQVKQKTNTSPAGVGTGIALYKGTIKSLILLSKIR